MPDPDPVPVVIVVDIDPDTHAAADRALPETECIIMSARSSEMALKLAERRPPTVLVVGDRVPGFSQLIDRVRRSSPHAHVVLLASLDQPEAPAAELGAARATRPQGIAAVMRKPVDPVRLRSTLRTALRLSAMAAGVKRMHGGAESGMMPRVTLPPWAGPGRENK